MTQPTPLFDSLPSPERHIRRLETIATLLGRSPAAIDQATVLDIGCGLGALLLAMAVEHPNSTFVGVDYSSEYLGQARANQKVLGLTNVSFIQADINDFSWPGAPFDYVISHGVFSWAGPTLAHTLLERTSSLLAPNGIAAISFNPWPGFHQRETLRGAILGCLDSNASEQERIRVARAVLASTSELLKDAASPTALALSEAVNHCRQQSDRHILHSLLMPNVTSISLSEFIETARQAGLGFLADARPLHWKGERYRRECRSTSEQELRLDQLAADELSLECTLDLLVPASFRVAVLAKEFNPFTSQAVLERVINMQAASPLSRETSRASSRFFTPSGGEVSAGTPWFAKVLEALEERWPESVPVKDLADLCADTPTNELISELYSWFLKELIELEVTRPGVSATVSERPTVHPLARFQVTSQEWVTTYRHGYATLDPFSRAICSLCDGSRSVTAIATSLVGSKGGTLPPGMTMEEFIGAVNEVLGVFRERALLSLPKAVTSSKDRDV
jgi:SAM-dependent methyltransferase